MTQGTNVRISDLPPATLPLVGDELVEITQNGLSRSVEADDLAASAAGLDASFLTVDPNAILINERVLTAGTNVSFVDSGPNGTLTINVTGLTFPLLAPDGTAGAPSYSWSTAPTTGIHLIASNLMGFSILGTTNWEMGGLFQAANNAGPAISNTAVSATVPGLLPAQQDPNTGIGSNTLDQLSLIAGGAEIARATAAFNANQFALIQSGSTSVPELTSLADPDTGFRWTGANQLTFIGSGSRAWHFTSLRFFSEFSQGPALLNVTADNDVPTVLADQSDADTGIGSSGNDEMSIIAGGVEAIRIDETAGAIQVIIDPGLTNTSDATPPLAFGGGTVGFRSPDSDQIFVILSGAEQWGFTTTNFRASIANGPALQFVAPSDTVPSLLPNKADLDSGIGQNAADQLSLIAGGVEIARAVEAVGEDRLIILPADTTPGVAAFPALQLGGNADGFFLPFTGQISVSIQGTDTWKFTGATLRASDPTTGPGLVNAGTVSLTNAGLAPIADNIGTGVGSDGANTVSLIVDNRIAVKYDEATGRVVQTNSNEVGLTASVTQTQAGGLGLRDSYNEIATVANSGDALTAFSVAAGDRLIVINNGVNALQLFPASGDNFGEGVDTAIVIDQGNVGVFLGRDITNWDTLFNGSPENAGTGGATLQGTWRFDSSTVEADPGSGDFRLDNATVGLTTEIFISQFTRLGFDADIILGQLAAGDQIFIQNRTDASEFLLFDITANVDNGGWFSLAGTVNQSGSNFTSNRDCGIVLLFTGGASFPGTVTNSMLRFDGADYIEETQIQATAAGVFSVFDAGLTDSVSISHDGASGFIALLNANVLSFTGASLQYQFDNNVVVTGNITAAGGNQLVALDSVATDSVTIEHNGTDGIITTTLGGKLRFTGTAGTDVTNEVGNFEARSGNALIAFDSGNADLIRISHNGADTLMANTGSASVLHTGVVIGYKFDNSIYSTEQAAANADTAGEGQFWVRDDAPNTAMFTNDAGIDKSLVNDVAQARRTTDFELTTAFVDITFDTTDVETDSAVLDHDLVTNTDNIIIGQPGTYKISYEVDIEVDTTGESTITAEGRVRVNDGGVGLPGSDALCGVFSDGSIPGDFMQNHLSQSFYVTLAAGDFVTLQLEKVEISGTDDYFATRTLFTAERCL